MGIGAYASDAGRVWSPESGNNERQMAAPARIAGIPGSRLRAAAVALVWGMVSLIVGASLGVPIWLVVPLSIVLGVLATVVMIRLGDRARAEADEIEREIVRRVRELAFESPNGSLGESPESAESLAATLARSREASEERASRFEAIVNAIDSPTIAVDAAGTIMLCNAAATALFGADFRGLGVEEAFTQPDLAAMPLAARRGTPQRGRVRIARPSGVLLVDVAAAPFERNGSEGTSRNETGAKPERFGVVMTLRDVTELATAAQLKTDFVANASHELRTPLASIRAAVETIQDHGSDDSETRERFLRTIAKAAARLEDLCNDLLDLSRVETTEQVVDLKPVGLAELCEDMAEVFAPVCAERGLTIRVEVDPGVGTVRSDHRLLHAILKNLIENAVKFAYEGTTVRVSARAVPGERPDRAWLRIEVSDKGIGIPIALQGRIFERFFQGDPSRAGSTRGTGLGLAIVKHAVRSLGGRIAVESVWKQGTTMRVELPDALVGEQRRA